MKRIQCAQLSDLISVAFAVALVFIGPSAAVATDLDENGVEDSDEQALADRFCPTLVLHRADQDVSPEPVEMVTDQLFRLYRASATGEYNGDGFAPWSDFPPSGNYTEIDGWMWGGPYTREALYCDPQPQGSSWELYHFDYAGPGPLCVAISNAYDDQPGGWYDAYHNGRTWHHPDHPINVYYPPGSEFPTTTYAHIFRHPNGTQWVIQYWFFYPFNDWINNHEGDWEHINVIVSSNNPTSAVVESVVYFFHEKFKECDPVQSENPNGVFECYIVDGTHPVVFVGGHGDTGGGAGEGSHGSYPVWGKWEHVVLGSFGPIQFVDFDETVGGDGLYIPWFTIVDGDGSDRDGVMVVKNTNQYNYESNPAMSWLKANVAWGHVHVASIGQHQALANFFNQGGGYDAPLGPAHQPTWNNVDWDAQHEYVYLATDFPHASQANWSPPPPTALTHPVQNATVFGSLAIRGTIHYADDVVLEWGVGANPATWQETGMHTEEWPLVQSVIGTWNTGVVPSGTYTIRVRAYNGGQPTDIVRTVSVTHRNISVAPTGGDFESIQGGIDFAATGDTVRVTMGNGAYYGSITMKSGVYLTATGGPVRDVFGDANVPTVTISNHDYPCVIDGFTFRHNHWDPSVPGSATEHGAKITNSKPVFRNCEFKANVADYGGGVLVTAPSRPRFENCKFSGNRANVDGGGIAYRDPAGIVTLSGRLFCSGCAFVANLAAADNAGSAVSMSASLTMSTEFSNCTFTEHDIYATSNYDETTVFLQGEPEPTFVNCTFFDNGTADLIRMIDCYPPLFDKCTFAHNTGVDGVLGWLTTPSGVKVYRSIVAFNSGPLAVGGPDLQYKVDLRKSILFSNVDHGRGPSDSFWAGVGQTNYRIDPAFCSNQQSFDLRLYAFSPASAPAPPNAGYFGERVGAFDVGCVPPAVVTATSSVPIPSNPSLVLSCPQGDVTDSQTGVVANLVVSVDLNGPITRNIDKTEITLDVHDFTARVFDQTGYIEAGSDAVGTQSYQTTLTHRHFGGYGAQAVDVLLNGFPLAQKAAFTIRTADFNGNGVAGDMSDFGFFANGYPVNPAVNDCRDFNNDGQVNIDDFSFYSFHYHHTNPYPPANTPSEAVQSNAGVALRFTEEYPTATTHRLFVDVEVENFANVTASQFAMAAGSQRLTFVEWNQAESSLGIVLFAPILRDGEPQLFFGTAVSESFNGATSHLGQFVFDVAGTEPFEVTADDFVLTAGEVLLESAGEAPVVAQMDGVFARTFDPAVARVYHNRLEQNFPNPFNPTTTLAFSLKDAGNVSLTIYDVAGRRVRELVNEQRDRGAYKVVWDGQNDAGQIVASGVYFYKMIAGSFTDTKKMTILK